MRFFVALSLLATTFSGTTFFDPPNPTSSTAVTAHVTIPSTLCLPGSATVTRNGSTIAIALAFPPCPPFPPGIVPFDYPVSLGVLPAGVYDVVSNGDLDRGTLVVRDAAPPFDMLPNVVPTFGGQIRLRSNNGAALYGCTPAGGCESFTVKIGGREVSVIGSTQTDIVLLAPPHAAGALDVSLERASGTSTAVAALDYFDLDKAPDPAFFEPVVFPALVTGAGAYGSQWSTDAALRNENDLPLPVVSMLFNVPAQHATMTIHGTNAPAGVVYYAARQFAARLFFDVMTRDLSHQAEALGTEIPVAREKDLYDHPFSIMFVPADAKNRTTLRIVRTDGVGAVNLRIFAMSTEIPLVVTQVPLAPASPNNPMFTTAAISDLVARFPQLAGQGPLRIEIAQSSSRAVWALVSVTNNDTQHVTVIAPH